MSGQEPGALERLRRRDEMLQILFWLEGEGFEADMTPSGVARFLGWAEPDVAAGLRDLEEAGLLRRPGAEDRYELTKGGRSEGGRRFVEEFSSILSRPTHYGGECHDPECGCHDSPLGAAACTSSRSTSGEEIDIRGPSERGSGE